MALAGRGEQRRGCGVAGFAWLDAGDSKNSVLSFLLLVRDGIPLLVAGEPRDGSWLETLNSDAAIYGGRGAGNFGRVKAMLVPAHGQPLSLTLTLPPHGVLFLVPDEEDEYVV
jgi:1,4-alpha-glucan branching enzyme